MNTSKGQESLTSRYLAALVAPTVIAGVMQVTWPFFERNLVSPYLLAVIFCAWYGGLGPGLLSVIVSFFLIDYFFIEPYFLFWLRRPSDVVRLILLIVIGTVISVMSELMYRERRRSEINLESVKRAESSLREKERFANQIAELSPVVINVVDLATRRDLYISPDVVNLIGYTPKEILEMEDPFSVLWHPEDTPKARQNVAQMKNARDGEIAEVEYRMRRRDGEWRWIASRTMPFERDENGIVRQMISASVDITARKQAERAQRERQQQYETLVHSIDGIVWEADPQTFTFTFVSKQAERILGYPLEQWFEGPDFWPDHMHPDDRSWAVNFCVDATARRVDHQFEYRMIAADGHVVWLSDIVSVHVADDQSVLLRGVMLDITERKVMEEKLRQSESQLAEAQRLASVGSWNWDIQNNIHSWSDELFHMYGLEPHKSEPSLETFIELVHPEDRSMIGGVIEHAIRTQEPIDSYLRIIRPDGSERTIHSRGNTISDLGGVPIRMHGTVQDVTERKQAEDALSASRRYLQALFDNSLDAILVTNDDGRYIDANPAASAILGYSHEELMQLGVLDLTAEPFSQEGWSMWQQFLASGSRSGEYFTIRKDGTVIQLEFRAVANILPGVHVSASRDITERKRAEEALRESEERYRELFENAKDATYVHDLNGRYTSVNRAAEKLTGRSREEIVGRRFTDFVPPDQIEVVNEHLDRKLADEGETTYETEVITNDGRRVPVEVSSHLIYQNGANIGVQGTARDITERKRAEELLRMKEQRFRSLIENSSDAIALFSADGKILYASPSTPTVIGFAPEQLLRFTVYELVHPEDQKSLAESFTALLKTPGMRMNLESRVRHQDGSWRWLEGTLTNLLQEPEIGAIVNNYRDITERRRAEDDLRQQKEMLQKIFDHIPVMIRLAGPDGNVQLVNREYERTMGWSLAELQKKNLNVVEFYPEKHQHQLILDRIVTAKGEWADFKTKVRDGRIIDTSWTTIHLSAGMDLGIGQDISERKRAEEMLRTYSRQLIAAQETERQHIARELHDQIGQVLTAVRINLQTIWNSSDVPASRSLIDEGILVVDQALEQVRDLSFELRPSLLDDLGLTAALRWCADRFANRTTIQTKSTIRLKQRIRLRPELETACYRIVQEALTNVARHAGARNVAINLRTLNRELLLSIKDDGIGFDAPFLKDGSSSTRLGLRGMRERALALGGRLEIESASSLGTEIRAYFPNGSNHA